MAGNYRGLLCIAAAGMCHMRNADHKHLTLQCRGEREIERERKRKERERERERKRERERVRGSYCCANCSKKKKRKLATPEGQLASRVFCTIDMHQARRFNFNYSL
jgi:hypothetical protein